MKSTIKYAAIAAVALLAASCKIDYVEPDQNLLPQASALTPKITVDQSTNMVTFEVEDTGVVPLWIFGSEKIDGKASKKYAYAQNGVTLRIRDAGEHSVELKAYNANGISQGSKIVTFTMENTYRDPFDATPYMKAIANTWAWDSENADHFGCGPTIEINTPEQTSVTADNWGKSWWAAGANEKADWSLYDDTMTFTADGQYTYNPGDGQVYVNCSSGYKPEYLVTESVDYVAPIDEFTCKYTIENNWNDAGIEEIFLVLPEGKNLSYIPNAYALQNPRYQFIETTTSKIKKNLLLVLDDHSSISWRYSFVPYVKQAGPEEILAGTSAEGKAWVMDSATKGHLGCGQTVDNPAGWWSAGAYEKEGTGMYDDVLTFFPDGTYTFSAGEDGLIYVNKDVTAIGSDINPHDGNDFSMPWDDQKSTYTFDGETLSFPAGVIIGYVPNDTMFNEPTFTVTEISENKLVLVHVTPDICWQYIFRARDYEAPSVTFGGQPLEGQLDIALTKGQSIAVTGIDLATTWIDPDYFTADGSNLKFKSEDGDYRIMYADNWIKAMPLANDDLATYENAKALWAIGTGIGKPNKAGAPGWSTGNMDLPLAKSGNTYTLTGEVVAGESFKIFGQANWGTEWGYANYGTIDLGDVAFVGDGTTGDNGNIIINAGVEGFYTFTFVDNDGTLDVSVKPYTGPVATYFDIEGATNLWRSTTFTMKYWYADASWNQIGDPELEWTDETKKDCKIVLPDNLGGAGEWQGQTFFQTEIPASASKTYDFCTTIHCTTACTITLKIAWRDNDGTNAMLYDNAITLPEDEDFVIKKESMVPDCDYDKVVVIFDFGRTAAGSVVTLTDTCFQEHQEK